MRERLCFTGFVMTLLSCSISVLAADDLVAWWQFDVGKERTIFDRVGGVDDHIRGNFRSVHGSAGNALEFDGFTTSVVRTSGKAPKLGRAFTIEAWIALGAYPWNWCPIVSQEKDEELGYYFGVDSQGHVGMRLAIDGRWRQCKSPNLPRLKVGLKLRRWYHVAAVFSEDTGVTVYVNGRAMQTLPVKGRVDFAHQTNLLIGRNHRKMPPTHPVRTWATYPSWYSFDGIIDEVKIYNRALSADDIATGYETGRPDTKPDIPARRFPTVPDGRRFGAYYTKLKYYAQWDVLWRTGDYSDIVVQFDEHPIKVMFWRGSRSSPCWVTENGKWMADQSREVGSNWGAPRPREEVPTGCCEHMSDAQCRYSHVRLIENNDARVVVHWRYALLDVLYRQVEVDPATGWGLWGDEVYTIYPDGVGVRNVLPGRGGWQETIFLNEPGTRPEDNCELEAVTLVNLKGRSRSYSWEHGYPAFDLAEPIIQMTNLKSKYRPFMIFRPGSGVKVFNVEVRPEYSHFPWWNHWPVAQVISDGRHAQATDRASHSSLAWGAPLDNAALYGMTDKPAVKLVPLAKSWIHPPKLNLTGKGFAGGGYDFRQRAYVIRCEAPGKDLELELAADKDSPVVNPAFVVKNWGEHPVTLTIDNRRMTRGRNFRFGHRDTMESRDLVVWTRIESSAPIKLSFRPRG